MQNLYQTHTKPVTKLTLNPYKTHTKPMFLTDTKPIPNPYNLHTRPIQNPY